MSEPAVLTERRDGVLVVTLNRPQARNAVNRALAEGVEAAMNELDTDGELRAAVLTGDDYASWLGWVAMAAGVVGLVTASIIFFAGFTQLTDMVLFPIASVLFTAWIGIMGFLLWQKASVAAETRTRV
jgi:hypothetical protein